MPSILNAGVAAIVAGFAFVAAFGAVQQFDLERATASGADRLAGEDDPGLATGEGPVVPQPSLPWQPAEQEEPRKKGPDRGHGNDGKRGDDDRGDEDDEDDEDDDEDD